MPETPLIQRQQRTIAGGYAESLFRASMVLKRLVLKLPYPLRSLYVYTAVVDRWVDGDTAWLDVDLGFRTRRMIDFRLAGINTPERGEPGWSEATNRVNELAPVGTRVTIQSFKTDKYGRYIADVWVDSSQLHVNKALLDEGLAKVY